MAQQTLIVDHEHFSYDGLFDAGELYKLIDSFFYEKGWDKYEKMNQEILTAEGKQIHIVLEPFKNITDYFKLVIRIKINMTDVKDVEVEKDGELLKLNQGLVRFTFDGYVVSDRHDKWESTPFLWFLQVIFNKYIFRQQFSRAEQWLISDIEDIQNRIKTLLNVYKYETYTGREE